MSSILSVLTSFFLIVNEISSNRDLNVKCVISATLNRILKMSDGF